MALLLDNGADIEATADAGSTPLHAAAALNANPAVVQTLLNYGADTEAREQDGMTPLHAAAAFNKTAPRRQS